tara:strand:- start:1587 stop:1847 length:261 start_codon:yes stop_codon:yes gene_type:complete
MKKYILLLLLFFVSPVYASVDVNKCDNVKPYGKKIDCLTKLKTDALKEKASGPLKKINKKLENFTEKKKDFDKKNKTLWDMYKNRK